MMEQDLAALQGSWIIASLEVDGESMPPESITEGRIVVEGQRFVCTGMGAVYGGDLELHPGVTPPQIDMKFDAGPEKGNTNFGIYELTGETWKLCLATQGTVRPSRFDSTSGQGFALETLVRRRVAAKAKEQPVARTAHETTEFEGEWQMVSAVMNGKPMEESAIPWARRVTSGNETTVFAGAQVLSRFTFESDASRSPNTIDYMNTAGSNKGKAQQGIYALEGDMLTVCVAAPGDARPSDFVVTPGDRRTLTVWNKRR